MASTSANDVYRALIEEMGFQVGEMARKNCNGCRIDHPSQRQHACLMDTMEEMTWKYFDKVWDSLDFRAVLEKFKEKFEEATAAEDN